MSHVMRGEFDESTRQLVVVLAPSSTPDNQSRIRSRGQSGSGREIEEPPPTLSSAR